MTVPDQKFAKDQQVNFRVNQASVYRRGIVKGYSPEFDYPVVLVMAMDYPISALVLEENVEALAA